MSAMSCPTSAECGGCPLISYAPEQAREFHERRIRDAFRKQLGTPLTTSHIEWFSLGGSTGYRRRIRLCVSDGGRVGFFNQAKHPHCAALSPALRELLAGFVGEAAEHGEPLTWLHHLELREPDLDQRPAVYFVKRDPGRALPPSVQEELGNWLSRFSFAVAGEPTPVPAQRLGLPAVWHYVPISSFLQVNEAVNQRLVTDLVLAAESRCLESFCDLYAGSGNFALPLLAQGLTGCSVELDPAAAAAAQRAAQEQSLDNGEFVNADAGEWADRAAAGGQAYDLVLLDPPRGGVRTHLCAMASLSRRHLVYFSCNVQSLARDLGVLQGLGFAIQTIATYNMFQYTEHVETMVWLERTPKQ